MKSQDPHDASVGYEQARMLLATMHAAGIDQGQLWLYYFSIGGSVSEFEMDAFLHHSLTLPQLQRDLLAQAANEILAEQAPPRVPYTTDIARHTNAPGTDPSAAGPSATDLESNGSKESLED